MEKATRVLAFVLAGGEGRRLAPLTAHLAKPAAPFHERHRLIDFALSNLRNSGIGDMEVLLQYRPGSLLGHLAHAWGIGGSGPACHVGVQVGGAGRTAAYRGTADAIRCHRDRIRAFAPDLVAVFSADQVYRMDVREMMAFHLDSGADVTVAALPVPVEQAHAFGVIGVRPDGRIRRFEEKPARPATMPGRPGRSLVSMGNYLFSPRLLLEALEATHAAGGTDFGGDLLPLLVSSHRLMAYDFATNRLATDEAGAGPYWRDVGTIDAYFAAQMDVIGKAPPFLPGDPRWPIHCRNAPSAAVNAWDRPAFGAARVGLGAAIEESVLRRDVDVGVGARLSRCIVAEGVRIGRDCRLRNVIVDRDNHLPPGFEVGFDPVGDRRRWTVSEGGIAVIPRGAFPAGMPSRTSVSIPILLPSPGAPVQASDAWVPG
jgi:glucose-1-phosphate adenylyltransferase